MSMDKNGPDKPQVMLAEEIVQAIGEQVLAGLTLDQTVWLMCRRLVESVDFPLVWIGTKEPDGSIKVRALGGKLEHLFGNYRENWKGKGEKHGAAARAIQGNITQMLNDQDFEQFDPEGSIHKQGIHSGLAIPLSVRNQMLGVLNVYAYSSRSLGPKVIHWLERLAEQLSLGLLLARDYDYLRLAGTAVSSAKEGVCIANPDGCIEWVNEAYCRITGYGVNEVIGAQLPSFPWEEIRRCLKQRKAPPLPGQFWRTEWEKTHTDGRVLTVEQILTPLLDEQGLIKNFVSILYDITARKQLEAQMVYRAHHDPLTDLPNRVMFLDRLNQALARARRNGSLVALMYLDLDRFKPMNDEFGHGTGDKILQAVAVRLNQGVRATDTVARLSGDEFTVILQDIQQVQDVCRLAQKILDRLSQPLSFEGPTVSVRTSMGISLYPFDGNDPDLLLQRADRAMYEAKSQGGQCWRFASEELNGQFAQQSHGWSHSNLK